MMQNDEMSGDARGPQPSSGCVVRTLIRGECCDGASLHSGALIEPIELTWDAVFSAVERAFSPLGSQRPAERPYTYTW